jgi:hypothetical protein
MIFMKSPATGIMTPVSRPRKFMKLKMPSFPLFIAAKGGPVPDIPDISPETENTFYSLVHGQSLV